MTRKVMLNALLFCSMLAGSVWAHHMAEGIISDEIWQMIDENLQEADSPHLNIDFDDVMGSMRVAEDDDGDLYLVSGIVVYPEEVEEYLPFIEAALDEANTMPSGTTRSGSAAVGFIEVNARDDGYSEILLYEPIGNGNSQVPPVGSTPGKRG